MSSQTRHSAPGGASAEYIELVGRIREFAEAHGRDEVTRAVADGLEDTLKPEDGGDISGPNAGAIPVDGRSGGTACIGRLKGASSCQHGMPGGWPPDEVPHAPPHRDHADLWLRDGEAVAYTMHLYDVHTDQLRDLVGYAEEWDFEVMINPASWYFPNRTVHVVFYNPPEGDR